MKLIFKYFLCFVLALADLSFYAQDKVIDSLKIVLKTAKEDTTKVDMLNSLAWKMRGIGEFSQAFQYAEQAALSNIGNVYWRQKNQEKALEYQFKVLKLREEYLPNGKQVGNKRAIANLLGNIGIVYNNLGKTDLALEYHLKSLPLMEESGNKEGEANTLNNIGNAYGDKMDYEQALNYYKKALAIYEDLDNKSGVGTSYFNIADVFYSQNNYSKAEEYHLKSLNIVQEIGDLDGIKDANLGLYEVYQQKGLYEKALNHYKKYISARDSLVNEENTKQTVRLEMNFEFDKKEAAAKIKQEKKEALSIAESKKKQIIIWAVCAILLLVFCFAVFAYRSFLQKQKSHIEITQQKHIIEEKQKEILDSIHYAKRIQTALITSEKYIERNLNKLIKK